MRFSRSSLDGATGRLGRRRTLPTIIRRTWSKVDGFPLPLFWLFYSRLLTAHAIEAVADEVDTAPRQSPWSACGLTFSRAGIVLTNAGAAREAGTAARSEHRAAVSGRRDR